MRGQMPGGRVRLRVKPGWVGQWGGAVPFCPRFIPSPAWVGHCIPGAGLGKHRSVSDLGAAGGLGRRTGGMAGQGYDASGPATGPCLCEGHG